MRRPLAIALTLALVLGLSGTAGSAAATDPAQPDTTAQAEADIEIDETTCFRGQALVTLTLPKGADSPLIHEGFVENDPRIRVKDVMNFGSASEMGSTRAKRAALSEKTMIVSLVSSSVCDTEELMAAVRDYSYVVEVSPNYRLEKASATDDPLLSEQLALDGDHFYSPTDPSATFSPDKPQAAVSPAAASVGFRPEDVTASDKDAPVVAVLDDGIDFTHEDLSDRMWVNPYPSLKGTNGYDFCNDDEDPSPGKNETHATAVAGIIAAASGNGKGIAGISQNAKLMNLKLFDDENDDTSGSTAAQLAAYEYVYTAARLGVNVVAINCSFAWMPSRIPYEESGSDFLSTFNTILTKLGTQGVLVVSCAGNESTELNDKIYGFPFEWDPTYSLIVGAVDKDGNVADFSNYGSKVDLMAPGVQVLTTTRETNFLPETYDNKKREKLCRFYDTFDSEDVRFLTYRDLFPETRGYISVSHSYADSHGDPKSGSTEISLDRSRVPSSRGYMVYYDVSSYTFDITKKIYISAMVYSDGSWSHLSMPLDSSPYFSLFSLNDRTYIGFDIKKYLALNFSHNLGQSIWIDDLALSTDDPDPEEFGRYEYEDGTSFSTPYVCGAIARLAALYPNDNTLTRKKKLFSTVKKTDALKSACSTGGMLNIAAFADTADIHEDDIVYKVTKVKLNRSTATLKAGKTLTLKATTSPVYATNPGVKWKVSNTKYASVTQKGVVKAKKKGHGHTVTVTATAKDGSKKKATCKIKIKK